MTPFRARVAVLAALVVAAALAWPAAAQDYRLGALRVGDPWARASIGAAKAGAAYVTIANHGEAPDRLIAVATPVARKAELHTHLMEDGVMKMRPVAALEVAPGEPAVLQPGGMHIMLLGLIAPLEEGEQFPLTLTFEEAGTIAVQVEIESPTSMGGSKGMEHQDHDAETGGHSS